MMPARIGLATPRAATSSRRRSYSSTLKKNCVIAKSAKLILKARCLRSDVRSGERGWPAGCAATPIDLKPRLRPRSTSCEAYSSSLYCSSPGSGSPPSASRFASPAARRSVIRAIGEVYGEHWRRTELWSARPVEPVDEDRLAASPDVPAQQMHAETLGDLRRRGIFGPGARDQARTRESPERLGACGRGGLRRVAAAPSGSGQPPSDLEVSGTHHACRGRIEPVQRHEARPLAGVADADRPPTEAVLLPAEEVALEPRGDLVSVPGHTRADEPHDLGISAQLGPSAAVVLTPAAQLEPIGQ